MPGNFVVVDYNVCSVHPRVNLFFFSVQLKMLHIDFKNTGMLMDGYCSSLEVINLEMAVEKGHNFFIFFYLNLMGCCCDRAAKFGIETSQHQRYSCGVKATTTQTVATVSALQLFHHHHYSALLPIVYTAAYPEPVR